jgi:hypothetical protein
MGHMGQAPLSDLPGDHLFNLYPVAFAHDPVFLKLVYE